MQIFLQTRLHYCFQRPHPNNMNAGKNGQGQNGQEKMAKEKNGQGKNGQEKMAKDFFS